MKCGLKDMAGQRFGRLVVMHRAENVSGRAARWACRCDCGGSTVSGGDSLRRGRSKSCGCLSAEHLSRIAFIHGMTGTRTHRIWTSMLTRVTNPNRRNSHRYVGRKINVCTSWLEFANFLSDMGEAPAGKSLDRYPNRDGNYEPGNCRWATYQEQARNACTTIMVTVDGIRIALRDACDAAGISFMTARGRRSRGWPEQRWLEQPPLRRSSL